MDAGLLGADQDLEKGCWVFLNSSAEASKIPYIFSDFSLPLFYPGQLNLWFLYSCSGAGCSTRRNFEPPGLCSMLLCGNNKTVLFFPYESLTARLSKWDPEGHS